MASRKNSESKTTERLVFLENQMPVDHLIFLESLPEELAERKEKAKDEIAILEDRIKEAEENEKTLKKSITRLKGQKTKLENNIAELRKEIERINEEKEALGNDSTDILNNLKYTEKDISRLQKQKEEMEITISDLETTTSYLNLIRKPELEKQINDLNSEITENTKTKDTLQNEISDLQRQKKTLEEQLANEQQNKSNSSGSHTQKSKNKKTSIFLYLLIGLIIGAAVMEALNIYQEEIQPLITGNTITFGSYDQDGNPMNGYEELTWRIQSKSDGRALLICDTCIEALPYNEQIGDNLWGNSSIRKWLNEEFYESAFSSEEKSVIAESEIMTGRLSDQDGHTYGELYGENETTMDRVFIPDLSDIGLEDKPINVSAAALNSFTANNVHYGQDEFQTMFWIRNPYGEYYNYACGYDSEKKEGHDYVFSSDTFALVRPAIYVDTKLYNKYRWNEFNSKPILNKGTDEETASASQDTDSSETTTDEQSEERSKVTPEELDSLSSAPDIHYYHLDLSSAADPSFGPDCWYELSQSKSGDELISAVRQEFFERLERDPVMAAACLAYVDREMGTYLTGKLYSEIEANWTESINNIADEFISHTDVWSYNVSALESMLTSSSSTSIEEVQGEQIWTFMMDQGSEHPVIDTCIYKLSEEVRDHYLTFDSSIKGSLLQLKFLVDSGFVPVLGPYVEQ